jgi:hypothetical protein
LHFLFVAAGYHLAGAAVDAKLSTNPAQVTLTYTEPPKKTLLSLLIKSCVWRRRRGRGEGAREMGSLWVRDRRTSRKGRL